MPFDQSIPQPLTPVAVNAHAPTASGVYGLSNSREWVYIGETDNIAIGSYGFVANPNYGHSNAYTVYDAAVHYDLGRMNNSLKGVSVSVNANNVFDKEYISTCDGFYCYYGDRRSVLASVDYKW